MSERGLPIVDGATACPFVAFEDDRDERSTRPDHRHRCYAEVRPASRALAHQEVYCLSTAFPACPTFQDWARREAARTREAPRSPRAPEPGDLPQRRPSQRDWAAPPHWAEGAPAAGRSEARPGSGETGGDAAWADASARASGAWAGTLGDPGPEATEAPSSRGPDTPDFLAPRDRPSSTVRPTTGAGLAESSFAATATGMAGEAAGEDRWADEEDEEVGEDPDGRRPTSSGGRGRPARGRRPSVSESRRPSRSLEGPSWERPQRFEAYPTLRTRVGLPNIPRTGLAFGGLILAALLLFLIPPMLIRPGGGDSGAGSQATPTPSAGGPSASLAPTPIPSPTPQVYVLVSGDTLSKVAKKFGITINDLLAANPSIKNADKVAAGQEIVIPVPVPSEVVDSGGLDGGSASPSAAP